MPKDRRATLLAEAERLIATRGYAGFSYADLAEVIGITKASIHYHFPSKADLVLGAIEEYAQRYQTAFQEIEARHASALDRIEAYARHYLAGLRRGRGCLCAVLAVEKEGLPEGVVAAVQAFFKGHLTWLTQIVERGQALKEPLVDVLPALMARLILSTLEGALLVERLLDPDEDFEGVIASLRALLSRQG